MPPSCCHTFASTLSFFVFCSSFKLTIFSPQQPVQRYRLAPDPIVVPKENPVAHQILRHECHTDSLSPTCRFFFFAPRITLGCQHFWFRNFAKLFSLHGNWMGHIMVECKSKAKAERWWQLRNSPPFHRRHKSQIELIYNFFPSRLFHQSLMHTSAIRARLKRKSPHTVFLYLFSLYFSN